MTPYCDIFAKIYQIKMVEEYFRIVLVCVTRNLCNGFQHRISALLLCTAMAIVCSINIYAA